MDPVLGICLERLARLADGLVGGESIDPPHAPKAVDVSLPIAYCSNRERANHSKGDHSIGHVVLNFHCNPIPESLK